MINSRLKSVARVLRNVFFKRQGITYKPKWTKTQQMFIEWNAERLGISNAESRARYLSSWEAIPNGHGGAEYRSFCDLSYQIFGVVYGDHANELFSSYEFYAPLHFLRMVAYPEREWTDRDDLIKNLGDRSVVSILDFGCGLAQHSRGIAKCLLQYGTKIELFLADIPTVRKDFLKWLCEREDIQMTFLDCTADCPIPKLPVSDVIVATEFYEHVYNPLTYFDRFNEALSRNGLHLTNIGDHQSEFMHVNPNLALIRERIAEANMVELIPNMLYQKH